MLLLSLPTVAEENKTPEGFVSLFNGKDLSGWCGRGHVNPSEFKILPDEVKISKQTEADANLHKHWRVEDGELINDGEGVYCTTKQEYSDFELLLEWKMVTHGTDSGIYLRGCPQVQIWDPGNEAQHKHGSNLGSGGLWNNNPGSPGKDPLVLADQPVGEWNKLKIQIVGDRVTVQLNGKLVVDNAVMHNFWDRKIPLFKKGPLQLQTHGGEMRFRNIYIRELNKINGGHQEL